MSVESLFHWAHVVAVVIWLGGLAFLTLVLAPSKQATDPQPYQNFVDATLKFRNGMLVAILFLLASGGYRIMELGGMKHVPLVIHIKFAITLVMVGITLVANYGVLPKLVKELQAVTTPFEKPKNYFILHALYLGTLAMGIVALFMLAQAGFL